jgi:hypothetical protein
MSGTRGFTLVTILYIDSPAENRALSPQNCVFNYSKAISHVRAKELC